MDIEILLNFNYEHLKNYLLNSSVDERKKDIDTYLETGELKIN